MFFFSSFWFFYMTIILLDEQLMECGVFGSVIISSFGWLVASMEFLMRWLQVESDSWFSKWQHCI